MSVTKPRIFKHGSIHEWSRIFRHRNLSTFGKVNTAVYDRSQKLPVIYFLGTGPSSYKKRIYRAAVSQRLRNTALEYSTQKHTRVTKTLCSQILWEDWKTVQDCLYICLLVRSSGECNGWPVSDQEPQDATTPYPGEKETMSLHFKICSQTMDQYSM
jgi:hypothetical protein